MDGNAADVAARKLHLADVDTGSNAKPMASRSVPYRLRRAERACGSVESRPGPWNGHGHANDNTALGPVICP